MYSYNRNFFEEINTEEKAYWAGFIAADGNIRKDFHKMRIELNIQDKEHLEKFKKNIEGNMPIRENIRFNNHSCYIDLNSVKICKDLNKIGITPNKSLTLDVNLSMIKKECIHHFYRGYFDGDGSLCYSAQDGKVRWQISFIGTEKFLTEMMNFYGIKHQLSTCGNNFRFNFSKFSDVKYITSILYQDANIYLDRKYKKFLEFDALNDYQAVS